MSKSIQKLMSTVRMTNFIEKELKFGAHNYKPLPVVLERGKGVHVWDVNGKRYLDFLSAYSAVNQGHCHPRLQKVLSDQASQLTLTSRAFHNLKLCEYQEFMCKTFGYDKLLPMNTGVEASETSIKLARKWGYEVKRIPENLATIIFPEGNFWGRSIGAISASTDPSSFSNFGPFVPNFEKIPFNDTKILEEKFKSNPNIAAYMMEPIQGEAGVIIPSDGYLEKVRNLCDKYNVLLIFDEVQTGLGRTGKLLAGDYEGVKPDILVLGKALSGGFMPVSAVLTSDEIMLTIKPGQHGSTFGGNPLGSALGIEAVKIILEEKLVENSFNQGNKLRNKLKELQEKSPVIDKIRGRGLMTAIEINEKYISADELCKKMMEMGLLAKTTHGNIIRLSPPLIINDEELDMGVEIIKRSILN